ncbi:hypothetical protein KIN20_025916 [Parelaphostrongylus tenuis]|uniref:Uncharacterized protein n=1 Tax=Parelaphostrongylus tenuis TaxID=148309 RepID=A0AAD5QUS0_PARTN|nr:hypothetical protein KIN20_025916 [Parelaphostrongylus tenuis]
MCTLAFTEREKQHEGGNGIEGKMGRIRASQRGRRPANDHGITTAAAAMLKISPTVMGAARRAAERQMEYVLESAQLAKTDRQSYQINITYHNGVVRKRGGKTELDPQCRYIYARLIIIRAVEKLCRRIFTRYSEPS